MGSKMCKHRAKPREAGTKIIKQLKIREFILTWSHAQGPLFQYPSVNILPPPDFTHL